MWATRFLESTAYSPLAQMLTVGPDRTTVTLLYLSLGISIVTALVATWSLRRSAQLRRALCDLAEKSGQSPPEFRNRWFPRIGLKTFLLLVTFLAIVSGFFGKELLRAKRQDEIIERLHMADEDRAEVNVHYDLGWIGQSVMARVMRDLIHPGFGYRVNQLQVCVEPLDRLYESSAEPWTESRDFREISQFAELEALQISGLSLSPEAVEGIASLAKLKRVSFLHCRLPKGAVAQIAQLSRLEELDLYNCDLVDADLTGLSEAHELTRLSVGNNRLGDDSFAVVSQLEKLRYLDLSRNKLSGVGIHQLAALSQLEALSLVDNELDKQILAEFKGLRQLRKVYVYGAFGEAISSLYTKEELEQIWPDGGHTEVNYDEQPVPSLWGISDNRPVATPIIVNNLFGGGTGGQGGGAF